MAHLYKEGSGTTVDNAQGTAARDGTFKGSGEPAWATMSGTSAPAYAPYKVTFDGSNDYIYSQFTPPSSNQSYSLWVYISVSGSNTISTFIGTNPPANSAYDRKIITNASNILQFYITNAAGSTGYTVTGTTAINDSKWHHVVCLFDGTNIQIYLDGVRDDVGNTAGAGGYTGYATPYWNYGDAIVSSVVYYFLGSLSENAIFSRTLSSTEINDIKDNGLKPAVNKSRNYAFIVD